MGALSVFALLSGSAQKPKVDFAKDILPVLKAHCAQCHGAGLQSAGMRLDATEGIRKGGQSGALIIPGEGDRSLLVRRLRGLDDKPRMPMGFNPLPDDQIALIKRWIDEGAAFGGAAGKHWAYIPPKRPAPPTDAQLLAMMKKTPSQPSPFSRLTPEKRGGLSVWPRIPIDRFILARLEKEGLTPQKEATKETLIRRLSLDLTGLPPTVEEVDDYLADKSPNAYEKLVDRLLASPHYGERMARIWLDLARYADTNGYEKDLPRQMYLYRDWLINAFNQNMLYDEFTIAQLAGDLLPNPTDQQRIASAFHRNSLLNDEGGIDPEEFRVVAVMDRVNTTATTWMGTTLACCQCHSHKYDPFPQTDYYKFYAFFNTSEDNGRDPDPILRVLNDGQKSEMGRLTESMARAVKELDSVPRDQAVWEQRQSKGWQVAMPTSVRAGATTTILGDGSVVAGGEDPEADTYTVELHPRAPFVGLRLEALTHPSLPFGSSGRNVNGNFVVARVQVQMRDFLGNITDIPLADAHVDFAQGGHKARDLINGDGLGWAIAGFEPENRVDHAAVLRLAMPIHPHEGDTLVITLHPSKRFAHHNIGRFRLSVTPDSELASETPPTAEISQILDAKDRTKEQAKKLEDYYLQHAAPFQEIQTRIAAIRGRQDEINNMSPTVMVMKEQEKPRETHLLTRGDFRTPADLVTPATPEVFGNFDGPPNRLGLARWLVDGKNPLTARVAVNRLWEQFFGRGLVSTMEDFGSQGERPTHPELLDWLATEFVRVGWDVKAMQKLIVLSATYRQSSALPPSLLRGTSKGEGRGGGPSAKKSPPSFSRPPISTASQKPEKGGGLGGGSSSLLEKDPYNTLYARGPRFRAESEMVRDIALTASGRLNPAIGGPSVMPPQPPGIWEDSFSFYDTKERWKDEEGPNRYRRGLYTYWRRTAPFPTALTFDTNSRDTCSAKRTRTNTPLQALSTLNDPLFFECAGGLAMEMLKHGGDTTNWNPPLGIEYGFRACTSRRPTKQELSALMKLFTISLTQYRADPAAATAVIKDAREMGDDPSLAALIIVANVLLNMDETITKG